MNEKINTLQIINLEKLLNPKPPYECKSIRVNPDIIKLQEQEPDLFQDDYEEYIMKCGDVVYTRMVEVNSFDWNEDEITESDIEIISFDEYKNLPERSSGKLAKFHKEIYTCVWKARKNGINHYHSWHEPVYFGKELLKMIPVPELKFMENKK